MAIISIDNDWMRLLNPVDLSCFISSNNAAMHQLEDDCRNAEEEEIMNSRIKSILDADMPKAAKVLSLFDAGIKHKDIPHYFDVTDRYCRIVLSRFKRI